MVKRTWRRWLPAVVVPAVIATAVLAGGMQASAVGQLPAKTPQELIAMVGQSPVRQFSGMFKQSSHLGLPELPATAPASAAGALEFLTGNHSARIYVDGPQHLRLQVMDQLAERDLVRNGDQVWGYNSKDNSATQWTLPAAPTPPAALMTPRSSAAPTAGTAVTASAAVTPMELAQTFLAAITPSTNVSVGSQVQVAGRDAYQLVLEPRSTETLVGSVSIDVDAATGMPLGVDVHARGQQEAAVSVAFSKLDLATPSASLFTFDPPAGASVKQDSLPQPRAHHLAPRMNEKQPFNVSGTGWETVLQLPAGASSAQLNSVLLDSPLLTQATTTVVGGRLLSTALLNIYLTNDGQVFVGPVPLDRLQGAAAAK